MLGVDYSYARPGGAALKAKGYTFACRYLSYEPGKNISAPEVADLQANGISIVLVWETTANRALDGRVAGQSDAQNALQQADAVGFPSNRPIYFAVDFDTTEAQQAQIDDYFRGCADILGLSRVGVYGSYYVIQRCLNNGTAKWAWQTLAWSGGQQEPRNNIYQTGGQDFNGGVDIDEAKQADFGQWGKGGEDMADLNLINNYYLFLLGRAASEAEANSWLNQTAHDAFFGIADSQEAIDYRKKQTDIAAQAALVPDLQKQIDDLKQQLANQPTTPPTTPPSYTTGQLWIMLLKKIFS